MPEIANTTPSDTDSTLGASFAPGAQGWLRLRRAYQMLSSCNEVLIRATDEAILLQRICQLAVDMGGYLGAWVGFAQDDERKSIQLTAFAGVKPMHLESLGISWSEDVPEGRGVVGATIRGGKTVIVEDIDSPQRPLRRMDGLTRAGIKGLFALPLVNASRTFGVLILYSAEVIPASADEVQLLEALANDLAFGIGTLRARQEAVQDVQTRNEILAIQQELGSLDSGMHEAIELASHKACTLTGADFCTVDMMDGDKLVSQSPWGPLSQTAFPVGGKSLSALAVQTLTTVLSEDILNDPREVGGHAVNAGLRSVVVVPVTIDGRAVGALKVAWRRPRAFSARDVTNLQILVQALGGAIQRHQAMSLLRASESQYRLLFAHNPQPMWVYEPVDFAVLAVNEAMIAHYGYSEHELLTMTMRDIWYEQISRSEELARLGASAQPSFNVRRRHRKKDSSPIDVDISSSPIVFNGKDARLVSATDVTKRLQAERDLLRVSRAQQMLSTCNEALIRATAQKELLSEICRITVEMGGYAGAWVGYAHNDAEKSIERMAWSGVLPAESESEQSSWSEKTVRGQGPAGRSIRSGDVVIVNSVGLEDAARLPRKDELLACGIHSLVSLPLNNAQGTFGVLFLFASDVLQITQDEIKLLRELANDLAFGIANLRAQEEQRRLQSVVLKVAAAVSAGSGLEFFAQLARNMCEALNAQAAFVTRLLPGQPLVGRTLAGVLDGQNLANFDYPIQGTPCEHLTQHSHWTVNADVAIRYPQATDLARMNMQAYAGQRLEDAQGNVIGQIFVLFRSVQESLDLVVSTLKIFAARVAAEIQRQAADAHIRDQAALLDKAQDAIFVSDMVGGIVYWNRGAERLYGWTAVQALGHLVADQLYDDPQVYQSALEGLMSVGVWSGEVMQRRRDGSNVAVEAHWTLVQDERGQPKSILAINTDITHRKAAEREIKHLAFYDQLTKLPNRLLLMDRLQHALASCARSDRFGALLFIDLDNFKTLNDTLGHESGDLLLQQVATRLLACVRQTDTVSRFGGDEFVVMLEDISDRESDAALVARTTGENILAALALPFSLGNFEHNTTSSIGVAPFGKHHPGTSELLKQADLAMYQAKNAGRNAIRFFDPSMQAVVNDRVQLEAELRLALMRQEYLLHYQPQFNASGHVMGVEALVRWIHPVRGPVSPAEFIPVAEETGIIIPLGQWVLSTACQLLKSWQASEPTSRLTMAVNVSARQFRHPDFVSQVTGVVRGIGIDARYLKLELTESLLVDDLELTISKMASLKDLGLCFSLDDFGTGYSSLSYLKRLPLDQIKIDQSFVRDIIKDANDDSIVRTIIALGQSLGLAVIAEGVETAAQRDFLASHGCLAYQGYFFSRPLPLEALVSFLQGKQLAGHVSL